MSLIFTEKYFTITTTQPVKSWSPIHSGQAQQRPTMEQEVHIRGILLNMITFFCPIV